MRHVAIAILVVATLGLFVPPWTNHHSKDTQEFRGWALIVTPPKGIWNNDVRIAWPRYLFREAVLFAFAGGFALAHRQRSRARTSSHRGSHD